MAGSGLYRRIYDVVGQIPPGRVATYGQIARWVGGCGARQVGYAMAALADDQVPWHRVVNSEGRISARRGGGPDPLQRRLLEAEGVRFDRRGRIDLGRYRWPGAVAAGARIPDPDDWS